MTSAVHCVSARHVSGSACMSVRAARWSRDGPPSTRYAASVNGAPAKPISGVRPSSATVRATPSVTGFKLVDAFPATKLAGSLGHDPDPEWDRLAKAMYVPIDRAGVIRNHDAYRKSEEKGETPEAAAGLFPQSYDCSADVERATFEFYLGLADEYVGAPMLSAILGVFAARVGDRERALELFERGYADFVVDPFAITTEYDRARFPEQPVAGPFTANLGGFLTSCLYGLPGLRLGDGEPSSWSTRPVVMPAGWDAVEVERIWARGREARLVAEHGAERATISWR